MLRLCCYECNIIGSKIRKKGLNNPIFDDFIAEEGFSEQDSFSYGRYCERHSDFHSNEKTVLWPQAPIYFFVLYGIYL